MANQSLEYPKKSKRKLKIYNGDEVEVQVLEYSPEPNNFIIMQDEVYRLAKAYHIKVTDLVDCGCTKEQAFFYAYSYSGGQPAKPWDIVTRFYATYKVVRYDLLEKEIVETFYGSASAGHDNVGNWMFKSRVYEIAHKRAKVNGIRQALGLFEYKVEDLDDDKSIVGTPIPGAETKDKPHDPHEYQDDEPATEMQARAFYGILKRYKDNISELSSFLLKIVKEAKIDMHNIILTNEAGALIDEEAFIENVMSNMKKKDLGYIMSNFGNFSHRTEKPK